MFLIQLWTLADTLVKYRSECTLTDVFTQKMVDLKRSDFDVVFNMSLCAHLL